MAAFAGVAAAFTLAAGSASAQGYAHPHGHGHQPTHHVCYLKVTIPDVYQTVRKPVVKAEARWETKEVPAEYGEVVKKVLVKAGYWKQTPIAAVYETREKQVLVSPEKEIVHVTPPQFKIERYAQKVVDGYGHAKVIWHERKVIVKPYEKKVEKVAAVYKTEKFQVLVKPASVHNEYIAPVFEARKEKVIVKPAAQHKIYHPAVVEWVEAKVLVKKAHVVEKPVWKKHGEAC
jgi:hypothetical protein